MVGKFKLSLLAATALPLLSGAALAALPQAAPLVAGPVDDRVTVALTGDRPGALAIARDQAELAGSTMLGHVRLELKRPAELQAALDRLVHDQQVKGSADYQHWLKPADLRAYGPAQSDIDSASAWLQSHGLQVNAVSRSGMSIDFGGTAAAISGAFHTELHTVMIGAESHIANMSAPSIPAALSPLVTGVTLSNFFPKPAMHRVPPAYTSTSIYGTYYAVAPPDFATIYNLNPIRGVQNFYGQPITGTGITLAVVEQTTIKKDDWNHFRKVFGLSGYSGTLSLQHPGCASPGMTGDEGEAALDAEWSSAVAPDASIIEASCPTTAPLNFGVETTLQNLVEMGTPATIFSISYGGDEVADGFAFLQGWNNLLEEGASEGIAIFVSSGDSGSSAGPYSIATNGLFVNGLADSAYNVSVGGTDFYDSALNENSTYWLPKNKMSGSSAKSYIPEIPWDNSCASKILWQFEGAPGAIPFCNEGTLSFEQDGVGGSGGQSVFYAKPDWQLLSVPGMPDDGVRDQPDVSLFAANGLWGHFYLFCMSDANEGGSPCQYSNVNDLFGNAAGGTSFAAPAFAGIAALLQEVHGAPLGNPGPRLYQIAQAQYTSAQGLNPCNSTLGNKISTACAFNNITAGDIAEPCAAGSQACVAGKTPAMGVGVLSATIAGKSIFAYPAQPGYSLATGLGSVNVTNLLYNY